MANKKVTKKKVTKKTATKRARLPFGAHRAKLQVTDEFPGFKIRWFNDIDGRLLRAETGGWVYVGQDEVPSLGQGQIHQGNTDVNSKVSKIVSRGNENVLRAYLMKIKSKFYEDDQKEKERGNAQIDEALRQGSPGGNIVDNQYVPEGHVQQI